MRSWLAKSLRTCRASLTSVLGWRRMCRLAAQGQAPISVLFYHRVADHTPNPWTISCADFERQINLLRRSFDVIGLDEVQRRIRAVDSRRPAVAITFDDGYQDNNQFALPLLTQLRLPCTYFVSVDNVQKGIGFQHDIDSGESIATNTMDELRHWSRSGVEIGLHTRTHFDFSKADDEQTIENEIFSAHAELTACIEKPIRYFAVPFGTEAQLRPAVINAVYQLGMSGFCSAYGAYNLPGRDAFHIRRIHGDTDFNRFKNWIYFDQSKLSTEPLISYELEQLPINQHASGLNEVSL